MKIAAVVREQVADGTLVPGDPVPPITALGQQYGYCRGTVAKGLCLLEQEGILCRVRGLGYYVNSKSLAPLAMPPHRSAN